MQVYQPPAKFLQLWFEAGTHMDQPAQQEGSWGGLWTANSAESFACNAVSMYTAEETWQTWQQQGFSLLRALYAHDARLQVVKVSRTHSSANNAQRCGLSGFAWAIYTELPMLAQAQTSIAVLLDAAPADCW